MTKEQKVNEKIQQLSMALARKGLPKIKRPGSGRTVGSYSFVNLRLKDLIKKFNDPRQKITVGRKWAEWMGFKRLTKEAARPVGPIIFKRRSASR